MMGPWKLNKEDPGVRQIAEELSHNPNPVVSAFEWTKKKLGNQPYIFASIINAMADLGLPYIAYVVRGRNKTWTEVYDLDNKKWYLVDLERDSFGSVDNEILYEITKGKIETRILSDQEEEEKRPLWAVLAVSVGLPILGAYMVGTLPTSLAEWREPHFRSIVTSIVTGTLVGLILR